MSLRHLHAPKALQRPAGLRIEWDASAGALQRWADQPPAALAESDDPSVISVLDVIGEDPWSGGGFSARKMAAILRGLAGKPVTVQINSPGGDMFEGLAIYNLLREHKAEVSVRVVGFAASAASIIAMAGDRIEMARGAMMMVHNAWGLVIGNRHDFAAAAQTFAEFDASMASVYAARTGLGEDEVAALMDGKGAADGTWLSAETAIAKGFADAMTDDEEDEPQDGRAARAQQPPAEILARRRLDAHLAQAGLPRSERRRLLREASGTHDAAGPGTRDAADPALNAALAGLLADVQASLKH